MILFLAALAFAELSTEELPATNVAAGAEGDSCLATADCAGALECRNNLCVPLGSYTSCQRTADCPNRLRCKGKQCVLPGLEPPALAPSQQQQLELAYPPGYYNQTFPYEPGAPVPPGMHVEKQTRKPVWGTGVGILTAGWVVSGLVGTFGTGSPICWLPVIGAFISPATVYSQYGWMGSVLAAQIPLGIIQTVGTVLIFVGALVKKEVLVRDSFKISAAPIISPTTQGFSLLGEF